MDAWACISSSWNEEAFNYVALTVYLPPCKIILDDLCSWITYNSPIERRWCFQFFARKELFPLHYIERGEIGYTEGKYFAAFSSNKSISSLSHDIFNFRALVHLYQLLFYSINLWKFRSCILKWKSREPCPSLVKLSCLLQDKAAQKTDQSNKASDGQWRK